VTDEDIRDHIDRARALTPKQTRVQQVAFEEALKALEKLYLTLKRKGVI